LTWFRKDRRIVWIEGNDTMGEEAERRVKEFLSQEDAITQLCKL
jgi:hypothetical protein